MPKSQAQKEANKRYHEKIKGSYALLSFSFKTEEKEEIASFIKSTGLSDVDFLRWAVSEWKKQN